MRPSSAFDLIDNNGGGHKQEEDESRGTHVETDWVLLEQQDLDLFVASAHILRMPIRTYVHGMLKRR